MCLQSVSSRLINRFQVMLYITRIGSSRFQVDSSSYQDDWPKLR